MEYSNWHVSNIENSQHVLLYLKMKINNIKIKLLSYRNDVSFNVDTDEIVVTVVNLLGKEDESN